eukprot:m.921648 g.921648  ORF g.921648 m.921648 type:complete len:50 (+) comp23757_c0_seq36:2885-3034(+)
MLVSSDPFRTILVNNTTLLLRRRRRHFASGRYLQHAFVYCTLLLTGAGT